MNFKHPEHAMYSRMRGVTPRCDKCALLLQQMRPWCKERPTSPKDYICPEYRDMRLDKRDLR